MFEINKQLLARLEAQHEGLWDVMNRRGLDDDFLAERDSPTRKEVSHYAEWEYGIVRVMDEVALEWLNIAIEAVKELLKSN